MVRMTRILVAIVAMSLVDFSTGILSFVPPHEWANYKAIYQKTYFNPEHERDARCNYAANKNIIIKHNDLYYRGFKTYRLAVNQFTDMHFIKFQSLFPSTLPSSHSYAKPAPKVQPAAPSYDPRNMGFKLNIENQGTKCNSGWAYAAAKSIELFKAAQASRVNSSSLSAQNLIDCAGLSNACYNQIPQAAFDYLTQYKMNLYLEKDYKNRNNSEHQGMCTPPTGAQKFQVANLTAYSEIRNGNNGFLKSYVSAGMPAVVKFNPTSFGFMHYYDGVFQQRLTGVGSHYMVVVGYGRDKKTNMDYWLLLNSFGTTWGEGGLMKLQQTPYYSIASDAIFPTES